MQNIIGSDNIRVNILLCNLNGVGSLKLSTLCFTGENNATGIDSIVVIRNWPCTLVITVLTDTFLRLLRFTVLRGETIIFVVRSVVRLRFLRLRGIAALGLLRCVRVLGVVRLLGRFGGLTWGMYMRAGRDLLV